MLESDNWIRRQVDYDQHKMYWHLSNCDFESLGTELADFQQYRKSAAERLANRAGPRLALAVSGGVDSQAMLQSFVEAEADFDIVTLKFKDDLNTHDTEFAEQIAAHYGRTVHYVELDVMHFLTRKLDEYADRYRCNSPQFACHHWFYEQLIDQGYTAIVLGGDCWTPAVGNDWHWGMTTARLAWQTFSKVNNFNIHGNFLASTWQLNFSLACCFDVYRDVEREIMSNLDNLGEVSRIIIEERYLNKLDAFRRYGFNIFPQANKFTGFEKIKKYYTDKTGDAWAFERRFRHHLESRWPLLESVIVLTEEQRASLDLLYLKYSAARNRT